MDWVVQSDLTQPANCVTFDPNQNRFENLEQIPTTLKRSPDRESDNEAALTSRQKSIKTKKFQRNSWGFEQPIQGFSSTPPPIALSRLINHASSEHLIQASHPRFLLSSYPGFSSTPPPIALSRLINHASSEHLIQASHPCFLLSSYPG
ncbi:hypothetical protein RRG08_004263 [Elysia crispata]|uniref:Uncharacterized protein n=1 Tax=Elysia crispata TaxID=231223 RepID=A0AAE0ZX16_9GAST|nr:hypothetical protein RRG08_004263 [Elysia crispata]